MCVAVDVEHFKATFLQGNNNRVHKYMLAELLTQPWTFWLKLTSTTTTGSVVGFSIIVAVDWSGENFFTSHTGFRYSESVVGWQGLGLGDWMWERFKWTHFLYVIRI